MPLVALASTLPKWRITKFKKLAAKKITPVKLVIATITSFLATTTTAIADASCQYSFTHENRPPHAAVVKSASV